MFRQGSWLGEKAKPLKDDRRSYSSKTASGHQLAIALNFNIELKNVVAFRTFAFLHSQGLFQTSIHPSARSALPHQQTSSAWRGTSDKCHFLP